MSIIFGFLNKWQDLIGSLIGVFVAIIGSVLFNIYLKHQETIIERKRLYSNLILTLYDLQLFITRCEGYLSSKKESFVSFNKIIINEKLNYIEPSQLFDLRPEVYNSIQKIYNVANIIRTNIEKSEVTQSFRLKKNKDFLRKNIYISEEDLKKQNDTINIDIQDSIICRRYWNALSFVEGYLLDIYKNFNFAAIEIKKIKEKYHYLRFPKDIKLYSMD